MKTHHPFLRTLSLTVAMGVLGFATSFGSPTINTDTQSEAKISKSLAKQAIKMMEQDQDYEAAGELINEAIRINRSVDNLELKGDQYAKMDMNNNALYFYQKALEFGLSQNKHFDVEGIQKKILAIQPHSSYLLALADKHIKSGDTDTALHVYVQILEDAQSQKKQLLIHDVQNRIAVLR